MLNFSFIPETSIQYEYGANFVLVFHFTDQIKERKHFSLHILCRYTVLSSQSLGSLTKNKNKIFVYCRSATTTPCLPSCTMAQPTVNYIVLNQCRSTVKSNVTDSRNTPYTQTASRNQHRIKNTETHSGYFLDYLQGHSSSFLPYLALLMQWLMTS